MTSIRAVEALAGVPLVITSGRENPGVIHVLTAHVDGNGEAIPTALLEYKEDGETIFRVTAEGTVETPTGMAPKEAAARVRAHIERCFRNPLQA